MTKRLLTALALTVAFTLPADQQDPKKPYPTGMLTLGLAYQAKELCSCLWVSGLSEADCRKAVYFPELKFGFMTIDKKRKRTHASLAWLFGARAHFVSQRYGCQLD